MPEPSAWAEHLDRNGTTEVCGLNVGPVQAGRWKIPLYTLQAARERIAGEIEAFANEVDEQVSREDTERDQYRKGVLFAARLVRESAPPRKIEPRVRHELEVEVDLRAESAPHTGREGGSAGE